MDEREPSTMGLDDADSEDMSYGSLVEYVLCVFAGRFSSLSITRVKNLTRLGCHP